MTHQDECPAINDLAALLIEHGSAAMASAGIAQLQGLGLLEQFVLQPVVDREANHKPNVPS